jgi:opacity protein-like surface antigen
LLRRDFTTNPPTEVLSPARNVFLGVRIVTTNGVPVPRYTVKLDRDSLGPGETTKGTVVVTPAGASPSGKFKRWGLSLHAGLSIPHGNFNTFYNAGPNAGVDLEYRLSNTFSLEGIYTFHRFRGETFGSVTIGDLNLHQFSINGKVYGSSSPVRPFFNFGGGAYKFDPGSTHGGLNIGGGLQFDITPTVAVDAMYNFHNVFTSGSNTRFSTVQGGVRFRF